MRRELEFQFGSGFDKNRFLIMVMETSPFPFTTIQIILQYFLQEKTWQFILDVWNWNHSNWEWKFYALYDVWNVSRSCQDPCQ